jgi:hypothetical protein
MPFRVVFNLAFRAGAFASAAARAVHDAALAALSASISRATAA